MNGLSVLERRYRRLLFVFPADHRREYGEEMIGVLLASAPEGCRRPRLADAFDLIAGGLRSRLRRRGTGLSGARQRDALAVCSVALPVTLLAAFAVSYLWNLISAGYFYGHDFYLPSLALALPALIAVRYRRTAAVVALVAAAWFWFLLLRPLTVWIDGLQASYCVALLVQAIALAGSPGPRRAAVIMTWKIWLVLAAAGLTMGAAAGLTTWAASIGGPWPLSMWQMTAIVLEFFAAVGAGLIVTLPAPTALRLMLLLAVPALPCALWVRQLASEIRFLAPIDPFPVLAFQAMLALAGVSAVAALLARHASKTA